jgi:phage-related minor tail protein
MASLETIRQLTVRGVSQGLDTLVRDLNAATEAQQKNTAAGEAAATVTDRAAGRQISVAQAYERVARQYDVGYRQQQEVARVTRVLDAAWVQGSITAARHAEVLGMVAERHRSTAKAVEDHGRATGLAAHQWTNLSFQMNDLLTGVASGQSPLMVLTQQGGQLYQILSSAEGGVGGALKAIGVRLVGLATSAVGVTVGLAAIGATGVYAAYSWEHAQTTIKLGLTGIGRASGMTVAEINDIARYSKAASELSTASAREIATAIASTGRAGRAEIEAGLAMAKNFAVTFGVDQEKAGEMIARVFENPLKAAEEYDKRLGFLDGNTRELIRSLQDQNKFGEAGTVVLEGMNRQLAKAAEVTGVWAKSLDVAKRGFSEFWETTGRGAASLAGGAGPNLTKDRQLLEQLRRDREEIAAQIAAEEAKAIDPGRVQGLVAGLVGPLDRLKAEQEAVARKYEEVSERVRKAEEAQTDAVRRGTFEQQRMAHDRALAVEIGLEKQIELAKRNPFERQVLQSQSAAGVAPPITLRDALLENQEKLRVFGRMPADPPVPTVTENQAPMKPMSGSVFNDSLLPSADAQRRVDQATIRTLETRRLVVDQTKIATETERQFTRTLDAEMGSIGKTAAESEKLKIAAQLLNVATREGIPLTGEMKAKIDAVSTAYGQMRQRIEEARLANELMFQRSQIGRSPLEQQIASQLRSSGIALDSAAGEALASEMRLNEALKQTKDISSDAIKGFLSDIRQGTTATEAFHNALNRIADKLTGMAVDNLVAKAFGGLIGGGSGGGIFGAIFGGGGTGSTASIAAVGDPVFGTMHTGGDVGRDVTEMRSVNPGVFLGAPRFHSGLRPDEVPTILQEGEWVLSREDVAAIKRGPGIPKPAKGGSGRGGESITVHGATFHIDARNADGAQIAALRQQLQSLSKSIETRAIAAIVNAHGRTPGFLGR